MHFKQKYFCMLNSSTLTTTIIQLRTHTHIHLKAIHKYPSVHNYFSYTESLSVTDHNSHLGHELASVSSCHQEKKKKSSVNYQQDSDNNDKKSRPVQLSLLRLARQKQHFVPSSYWGWRCSSVGTASDQHATDAGLIPQCVKGFFSQRRLSVETQLCCPYTPPCAVTRVKCAIAHIYICAHVKDPVVHVRV